MKIYLDNCCFNRPYDDQSMMKVRLESEAKLIIQERIIGGSLSLAWSFILEYENDANPFDERRENIGRWQAVASEVILDSPALIMKAKEFSGTGLRSKDALHLASACVAGCDYFITTDNGLLKKAKLFNEPCKIINPVDFFTRELL